MIAALSLHTARFTKAELAQRLGGVIPFGLVMNVADIIQDPHFAARDMIACVGQPGGEPIKVAGVPIKMTGTPGGVFRRAPLLGEDTLRQLRIAGLSDSEIQHLIETRAAAAAAAESK